MLSSYLLLAFVTLGVVFLVCCFIGFNWEYRRGRRQASRRRAEQYRDSWSAHERDTKGEDKLLRVTHIPSRVDSPIIPRTMSSAPVGDRSRMRG